MEKVKVGEIWRYCRLGISADIEVKIVDYQTGKCYIKIIKNSGANNNWVTNGVYYIDEWQLNNYWKKMNYCPKCLRKM